MFGEIFKKDANHCLLDGSPALNPSFQLLWKLSSLHVVCTYGQQLYNASCASCVSGCDAKGCDKMSWEGERVGGAYANYSM